MYVPCHSWRFSHLICCTSDDAAAWHRDTRWPRLVHIVQQSIVGRPFREIRARYGTKLTFGQSAARISVVRSAATDRSYGRLVSCHHSWFPHTHTTYLYREETRTM